MTLHDIIEDICVTAYGWHWGEQHDTLYKHIEETLIRFRDDVIRGTSKSEIAKKLLEQKVRCKQQNSDTKIG